MKRSSPGSPSRRISSPALEIDHLSDREDAQDFLVGEVAKRGIWRKTSTYAIELLRARLARIRRVGLHRAE